MADHGWVNSQINTAKRSNMKKFKHDTVAQNK